MYETFLAARSIKLFLSKSMTMPISKKIVVDFLNSEEIEQSGMIYAA